tara:strand:+ start:1085 stop:1273 length:189 start_codon:yes stop_codon:yes gene_type:complete
MKESEGKGIFISENGTGNREHRLDQELRMQEENGNRGRKEQGIDSLPSISLYDHKISFSFLC